MPAAISAPYASTFRKASDLPQRVWDILNSHSRNANVILPQANKALVAELAGEPFGDCLWITCNLYSTVELVLACTPGDMGDYPVFIFTSLPSNQLTTEYLRPRIELLAEALRGEPGSIQRAYSVYSPSPITKLFVDEWTRITGVKNYKNEPYYAANITFCTRRSFINRQTSVHPSLTYDLRPAVATDIVHIAPLCHGFAAESFPFTLTEERALEETTILVHKKQVWVHTVRRPGQTQTEIASIVAFTRNSDAVGTISKVFTNPLWRRHGCAERLVRRVCKHLLLTKESVVLYVAHDNHGAAKVYHRVGFQGLSADAAPVEGVDPWLEIGFDRNQVKLGHW